MFYMYAYSDSDMRCEQARRFAGHGVTEDKALQPNTPELLDLNVLHVCLITSRRVFTYFFAHSDTDTETCGADNDILQN